MGQSLNFDFQHAQLAWSNLGNEGGGTVDGTVYSAKGCFERALTHKPDDSEAWYNLGTGGGGTVIKGFAFMWSLFDPC